jgi:cytochrome b561
MAHTSSLRSLSGRDTSYTSTAIALHWLIALLIICGFSLGWVMTDIPGFTPPSSNTSRGTSGSA